MFKVSCHKISVINAHRNFIKDNIIYIREILIFN